MSNQHSRSTMVGILAVLGVTCAISLHAVTVHSLAPQPVIYRATANNNDLDGVEGLATPGSLVELWYRQRNFREGTVDGTGDPFGWCAWKHAGIPIRVGATRADAAGVFRMSGLGQGGITVPLFPAGPKEDKCLGGLYTELLPRVCDSPGVGCTTGFAPTLHWLNLRHTSSNIAATAGSVSLAEQAAAAVADGPDTGSSFGDQQDVDQNFIDTTSPGLTVGQRVIWKCGPGGTSVCPTVTVHDASTALLADAEYPFVLGTIQAHRAGGSFIAAAAAFPRTDEDLGFTVNVNVRLRGRLDVNLGCDAPSPFTFLRQAIF